MRSAHVEDDAAIFEQRGPRMIGEIGFDRLRQQRRRSRFVTCAPGDTLLSMGCFAGVHGLFYQPCRARRLVMWAVWWRECHS